MLNSVIDSKMVEKNREMHKIMNAFPPIHITLSQREQLQYCSSIIRQSLIQPFYDVCFYENQRISAKSYAIINDLSNQYELCVESLVVVRNKINIFLSQTLESKSCLAVLNPQKKIFEKIHEVFRRQASLLLLLCAVLSDSIKKETSSELVDLLRNVQNQFEIRIKTIIEAEKTIDCKTQRPSAFFSYDGRGGLAGLIQM